MEQNNSLQKVLESAKWLKKIEAPPFLFTRIEQKIKNASNYSVPIKWVTVSISALIFLVVVNFIFISKSSIQKKDNKAGNELAIGLGLNYSNQLYSN